MKCFKSFGFNVTIGEMRRSAGIERELASRANLRVLRCFGHVEKLNEYSTE